MVVPGGGGGGGSMVGCQYKGQAAVARILPLLSNVCNYRIKKRIKG